MKRIILVLLSLSIIVITGCSSSAPEKTFTVGEVASSEKIEFTLEELLFADKLIGDLGHEDFLIPMPETYYGTIYTSEEGKILISAPFTVKNKGTETLNTWDWTYDIVYGDKYKFTCDDGNRWGVRDGIWYNLYFEGSRYVDPLTTKSYRMYFEVPLEVFENTSSPLKLVIHTNTSPKEITYIIR